MLKRSRNGNVLKFPLRKWEEAHSVVYFLCNDYVISAITCATQSSQSIDTRELFHQICNYFGFWALGCCSCAEILIQSRWGCRVLLEDTLTGHMDVDGHTLVVVRIKPVTWLQDGRSCEPSLSLMYIACLHIV